MEYSLFIPQFGNLIITVAAFVVSLSVIVFVHEFGHYFVGRISGIRAEVFSVGFGPVIFYFLDNNGTKWQIAAFPFGGFVKFLGDKNSVSAPKTGLKPAIKDDASTSRATMHGAPLWARFATVAAGPIFNFIFSGIIFFIIYFNQGVTKLPLTVEKVFDSPYEIMFEKDDIIRSINGIKIDQDFNKLLDLLEDSEITERIVYEVERNGRLINLENIVRNPPRVAQVLPKSAAISAGLVKGDIILSLNSEKIVSFDNIRNIVEQSRGEVLEVEFWRNGLVKQTLLKPIIVDVPSEAGGFESIYRIGIVGDYFPFEPSTQNTSVLLAVKKTSESIYLIMEGSIKNVIIFYLVILAVVICQSL